MTTSQHSADHNTMSVYTPPYQRDTCTLPALFRLTLLADRMSPCAGCNQSRARCDGEPRADGQARP